VGDGENARCIVELRGAEASAEFGASHFHLSTAMQTRGLYIGTTYNVEQERVAAACPMFIAVAVAKRGHCIWDCYHEIQRVFTPKLVPPHSVSLALSNTSVKILTILWLETFDEVRI
jgi:hypothetical protein